MARHTPDPDRHLENVPFQDLVDRIARRTVRESGGTRLRALADLRAAVESRIEAETHVRSRYNDENGEQLDKVLGTLKAQLTWREIGDELGVSAQAAHRRYGPAR
jgi:hypothetical protein